MKKKTALQLNLCDGGQFVLVVVCVLYYCLPRGRKNNNRRQKPVPMPCLLCVGAVFLLCRCRVSSVSLPCLFCARAVSALCRCHICSVPLPCLFCACVVSPLCTMSVWGYVRHQKRLRPLQFESYLRPTLNHSPCPRLD